MTKQSRYLTVEEAAELMPPGKSSERTHMTRAQLYNLIEAGEIKLKRKWVLSRRDVERLAAKLIRQRARDEAAREEKRRLEEELKAVRRKFATEGGGSDGEPGKV